MNIARVSANGQITVPVEIRRMLRLRKGDKVLFYKKDNGEVVVSNSSLVAFNEATEAVNVNPEIQNKEQDIKTFKYALDRFIGQMEGEWEKLGIHSEDDMVAFAAESRREYIAKRKAESGDA